MAYTQPGSFVLYKEPGSDLPPWPAVVYIDEYAPRNIQRRRPSGYVTLVLLLGEPYRFRWITTRQLSPLPSLEEVGIWTLSQDLRQAYEAADFMRDTKLGLDYWRGAVDEQMENYFLPESDLEEVEDDGEIDEELQEALRISHEAFYSSMPQSLPTPSHLLPKRTSRQSSIITLKDGDKDIELYANPPARLGSHPSPKRSRPSRLREVRSSSLSSLADSELPYHEQANASNSSSFEQSDPPPATEGTRSRTQISDRSALQQVLGWGTLGQRSVFPTSDVVDGELSESKDFIQLRIGPDLELHTLHKNQIWNRPYFRDTRTGTNHFTVNDDKAWELRHPSLINIDVDDFRFVAEYLADGEFGNRNPEGEEQTKEAIAQCVSAWETGEMLGMADMLEHVAEKVQFLKWDNADVLHLAIRIYGTSGPTLHAHEMMRDWISSYLAHHFWVYIKDEIIGDVFRKRLCSLPELERDVFVKRAQNLTTRAEADEDKESDEGKPEDDDEL